MSDKDPNKNHYPDDDDQDMFSPGNVQDAGESEEAKEAESQAKQTTLNLQHRRADIDAVRMECYGEQDLVKRAQKLQSVGGIKYVHFKPAPGDLGKMGMTVAKAESELNRLAAFDALFDFGSGIVPYPHRDTFRGRLVDHHGEVLTQKTSQQVDVIQAINAAGLENPTARGVGESMMIWAGQHKRDGLLFNFERNMKEWDGVERLENTLIELFKPKPSALTQLVGKYFWLSLYNRITNPGCPAPTSIALIGTQGAGKTQFSRILCETLMDDSNVAPIPLDWSMKDFNKFLRAITGQSIIANVAEMGGLKKVDIERMKDFATRDKDELDFKFEDTLIKKRQWIIITDGNSYEGLQRDETGNRRFYPIFVGQKDDENGQPAWEENFEVDYTGFREKVWQIMAECRAWMAEHGQNGYIKLVVDVQRGVQNFSRSEMENDRGTIKDMEFDAIMREILSTAPYERSAKNGWMVSIKHINGQLNSYKLPKYNSVIKSFMARFKYEPGQMAIGKGYFMKQELMDGTPETELLPLLVDRFWYKGDELTIEERCEALKEQRRKVELERSQYGGEAF